MVARRREPVRPPQPAAFGVLIGALPQAFLVRNDQPAFAAAHDLVTRDAEAPDVAEGAQIAAFELAAAGLCAILDHHELVFARNLHDGRHVGHSPHDACWHESDRPFRDEFFDFGRVHRERFIHVAEDRHALCRDDRCRCSVKPDGRADYLGAGADADRDKCAVEGASARTHPKGVFDPEGFAGHALEGLYPGFLEVRIVVPQKRTLAHVFLARRGTDLLQDPWGEPKTFGQRHELVHADLRPPPPLDSGDRLRAPVQRQLLFRSCVAHVRLFLFLGCCVSGKSNAPERLSPENNRVLA